MKKRLWNLIVVICLNFVSYVSTQGPVYVPGSSPFLVTSDDPGSLPTVTVRGFLNFRTTVDGTVIVFTPASESPQEPPSPSSFIAPSTTKISRDEYQFQPYSKDRFDLITTELENEAHTDDDRDTFKKSSPGEDTTPQEINIQKPIYGASPSPPQYPTGLVTVLGGTHINDGATTVFETKVIGTYIDGKYAQILQSTSQIIFSKSITPEYSTPVPSPSRPPSSPRPQEVQSSNFPGTRQQKTERLEVNRRRDDLENANVVLQTSFRIPESSPDRIPRPTQSLEHSKTPSRLEYTVSRRFRPTLASDLPEDENTVPETQNTRHLPPRFRYVLPRRTSPSVRLNRFKVKLTVRSDGVGSTDTSQENIFDPIEDSLEDYDPLQPVDPARVTYQKTTITSEVTLHVGRRKSVRTLTIITSVPKTKPVYATDLLNDPQEIYLANNNAIVATSLPDGENLRKNIITRTYTTTERMLKTSLVPILDGNSTSYHAVTESFFILKLITGYKTLPPGGMTLVSIDPVDSNDVIASTDGIDALLDGAITLEPAPHQQILQTPVPNGLIASGSRREHAILPLESSGNHIDVNPLLSLGAALQQNPLAAVYFGLQQLNKQATLYSTITKSSTYVATDTIYNTKVVSFYDGRRTRTRTLSESVSTTEKTMTTYTTTVTPYLNTQLFPQNQLQQLLGTQMPGGLMPQMLPPPPQYSTVTSTYTTVTTGTSLTTRVYTLIYNALSTKFRTITSTSLYETTVTATTTSEVPIEVTAPPVGGMLPYMG